MSSNSFEPKREARALVSIAVARVLVETVCLLTKLRGMSGGAGEWKEEGDSDSEGLRVNLWDE